MSKMLSIAGLSLALAGSLFVGSTITANAQSLDIQLGKHGIRPVVRDDDAGRDGCSPGEAMSAAPDEGYHHPRIVRVTDRRVTVEGMTDDGLDRISFANRPGCPVN
jgi:hypothetical protein